MPAHLKDPERSITIVRVGHLRKQDAKFGHHLAVLDDGWVTDGGHSGWAALVDARLADVPPGARSQNLTMKTIRAIAKKQHVLVSVAR